MHFSIIPLFHIYVYLLTYIHRYNYDVYKLYRYNYLPIPIGVFIYLVRGDTGGIVIVGAELCPLKKRC